MKSYSITITIHPLRWFRNLLVVAAAGAVLLTPKHVSQAADQVAPSPQEVARQRAVRIVDAIIAKRSSMAEQVRTKLSTAIVDHSIQNKMDPLFVMAVIENESGFDPRNRSIRCKETGVESTCYLNAQGLMQIIPSTAKSEIKRRKLADSMDMLDPLDNVNVGIGYMALLGQGFKRAGSLLWAYNQGSLVAMARAKNEAPEGWDLEKWEKAVREGEAFESRVLSSYRKLLADNGIKADLRKMNILFRTPETIVRNENDPPVLPDVKPAPKKDTRVASNP